MRNLEKFQRWQLPPNWVKHNNYPNITINEGKNNVNYKGRPRWINLKKIKTDCNCGFWKLVNLTVFQSSLLLFATFDVLLRQHICLNRSCAFEILKFQGQQRRSFRIPSPNFEIPLPGCSEIPFPVKISRVFPNPAPCFIQILHPENTLPDPVSLNPPGGGGYGFQAVYSGIGLINQSVWV